MHFTASNSHLTGAVFEDALILFPEVLNHPLHLSCALMAQFTVVDMNANGHLIAADDLVGETRIVRVQNKFNIHETIDKFTIV